MKATPSSNSHPCQRSGPQVACPADEQTAYQIQAANSVSGLNAGNLIWDSGKVAGDAQSGVAYAGDELSSREQVVWRVRVWDADGAPSAWSAPGAWEMGLLAQSDWGDARWIDYPGRTESQPMPIFARQFDLQGDVAKARLHVSGLGLHKATVNGQELTDEALAPGYSNFQLSAEYRTYDVTDELVGGSNTVGVQLGNGTAYVRRSVTNTAVGRTTPYSWWQSQLKGSGVLTEAAAAGATNVKPSSTANYHLGGTVNVDTGDGGDRLESRVITNIGTAPTTVAAANVITGTPAPVADRRQLDLERRRRRHDHPGRPDRPPQDLRRGQSGGAGQRDPARERRRRPHHLRQRHAGVGLRRRQQRVADVADLATSSRCSSPART